MSRQIRAIFIAVVLCAGPSLAGKDLSPEAVKAMTTLKVDSRIGVESALEVLLEDGSKEAIDAVVQFGATSRFPRNTLAAGKALAAKKEGKALAILTKAARNYKKEPFALARIVLMAEQIPGPAAQRVIAGYAKEKRAVVAATAIRSLGARKEEASRAVLTTTVKSKRPTVAAAAAFALSQLEPDQATMELLFIRAQKAVKNRVGDACALALSRMKGAEPFGNRALALAMTRTTHDSFHALTKIAMRLAKDPDRELLDRGLKSPSDRMREVTCDIIGLTKTPGFQQKLFRLANTEHNWRNKVSAWLALRRAGSDEVLDGIASAIGKPGEDGYWAIQCVLRDPPESVIPALQNAALDVKDPVKRELAQRALRNVKRGKDQVRDFYLDVVKRNRGKRKAAAALLGLGNLKDPQTFQALVTLLEKESEKRLQLHILKGLEKLTGHYYEPKADIWREWFRVVKGKVAFDPPKIDRGENRKRVKSNKDLGISPETERAVEDGLVWLSRHQDANGGWNGSTYHENCTFSDDCGAEGGIRDRPIAYTGLALLAFQGAGYSHLEGPYRDVMQRGWEYLLANLDYDGSHYEKSWTFSYEAAITCQALCDGYGLTGDPWLGEGAQRMIDYLVKVQYPGRTWRYAVRSSETDTSVMSWILTACIAARHAGVDMPEQIFVASEIWLNTAADKIPPDTFEVFQPDQFKKNNAYYIDVSRGPRGKVRTYKIKTWYQPPRLYTPAMSAIGVLCRIWLGWTRAHPFCIGGANQVVSQIPRYNSGLEKEYGFYPYTWYYGSLAMYQMGGRYWKKWREECIADVIKNQQRAGCHLGSWKMPQAQFVAGLTGGTVYCTCMAILTLETFYRYQPYLARFDIRSKEPAEGDEGKVVGGGGLEDAENEKK